MLNRRNFIKKSIGLTILTLLPYEIKDGIVALSKHAEANNLPDISNAAGISTGFIDFDKKTNGLHPSDLIIVAGRPSMGKTAFCLNIAAHTGLVKNKTVAIFGLEMSKEQIVKRMLCSQARVNIAKLKTGCLSDSDWHNLAKKTGQISQASIFIDGTPAQSVLDIKAKADRLQAEKGLDLIIIDYLELLKSTSGADDIRSALSENIKALKLFANESGIPIILACQLPRTVDYRFNKRPVLSDLKGLGAIEQHADLVVFIYREELYKDSIPPEGFGISEIIIGKNRRGSTGTVNLSFIPEYLSFGNL